MSQPIRTVTDLRRLFAHLIDLPHEAVGIAYLDSDWQVLGVRHSIGDSAAATDVPLRQIARDAVALDAARVVMAHNHPSGDPTPSAADRCATRRLAQALAALGAPLAEHLIVARSGCVGLIRAGVV